MIQWFQFAADAHHGRLADFQVQVASFQLHKRPKSLSTSRFFASIVKLSDSRFLMASMLLSGVGAETARYQRNEPCSSGKVCGSSNGFGE